MFTINQRRFTSFVGALCLSFLCLTQTACQQEKDPESNTGLKLKVEESQSGSRNNFFKITVYDDAKMDLSKLSVSASVLPQIGTFHIEKTKGNLNLVLGAGKKLNELYTTLLNEGKEVTFRMKYKVAENASEDSYDLTVKIEHEDGREATQKINFKQKRQ